MRRVGERTSARCCIARSGRPPLETTAEMSPPSSEAAHKAAAAPVEAPKYPIGCGGHVSSLVSQPVPSTRRRASSPMSNTFVRSDSSAGVNRSKSNVPNPARFRASATCRLRGL